jgi:hypothetical protein
MAVRFDMSKLIAARRDFAELQDQKVLEVTQKITLDLGKRLIEESPVRDGDFRRDWQIDTPDKAGDPGRIQNNMPYAVKLARGSSTQAPDGWIEDAVDAAAKAGGKE